MQILGKCGRRLQCNYGPLDRRNDLAATLQLEVFTHRKFVADVFHQKLNFTGRKTAKLRFVPPFGGLSGDIHDSSMVRWKARGRLPISID